jgi:hypothetical protein
MESGKYRAGTFTGTEPSNRIQMPSDTSKSRDSAVGIVSTLQAGRTGVRIPAGSSEQFRPPLYPTQWIAGFLAGGTGRVDGDHTSV